MNFEDLQKAWQSQDVAAKATINADVLLKEVRRNQQQFRATIFWRDVREVGVAYLLAVFFSYQGLRHGDWTPILIGFACFGVGTFMLVDRMLQRRKQTTARDPLKRCIEASLKEVNHQIWLLKNVFWWYLLPILIGLAAFTARKVWDRRIDGPTAMLVMGAACIITFGVTYWFVYWINQRAVREQLTPRRQELEALLASLNENPQ
jgi:hypothetical protein